MNFHKAQLDNGLTVIAELNPLVHSVALGFLVRTGSRDETPEVNGVSHFLEHMAFKGNEQYTAHDFNRQFDEIGADSNASTSEEVTTFHTAVLPEYLPKAFELLSALMRPSLREADFALEKNVILEEIGMYKDSPGWVAYENLMIKHFAGHPLEHSILGSTESISNLTVEQMRAYYNERYKAGNIVLAVTGNTDWDQILKMAEQYCADWPAGTLERDTTEASPQGGLMIIEEEKSFQQHVMSMMPAPSASHSHWAAAQVLSVIVGEGVNSRMYWDLLDPGHADAAQFGYYDYDGSGAFMVYLCCDPDSTEENLARMKTILEDVNQNSITETELAQAKSKVAASIVLSSEPPPRQTLRLGRKLDLSQRIPLRPR